MNTPDLENTQTATPLPPQQANPRIRGAADSGDASDASATANASTLIEFPGKNRNPRPAWRKELSERVREIQQRRAREAALDTEQSAEAQAIADQPVPSAPALSVKAKKAEERAKQLGLVPPPPDTREMNPIVVAALKRIERARVSDAPRGRATRAATAVARVAEEQYEPSVEPPPAVVAKPAKRESLKPAPPVAEPAAEVAPQISESPELKPETARLPNLVAVPPKAPALETTFEESSQAPPALSLDAASTPAIKAPPVVSKPIEQKASNAPTDAIAASAPVIDNPQSKPQPRRIVGVIDDHWLERTGADPLPKVVTAKELYDDRAPLGRRVAGALIDLVVVAFLSAPFAAIIELTIGNWGDPRVRISMGSIVFLLMFLYFTCSTALAGRTWGMSLFSLHTVDANSALAPTTGQCMRRTLVYLLTLATFGLGLLYTLFDAEGRAAHDLLSRTIVVKE